MQARRPRLPLSNKHRSSRYNHPGPMSPHSARRSLIPLLISLMLGAACSLIPVPSSTPVPAASRTAVPSLTLSPQPALTSSSTPLPSQTPSPVPTVESLKATVTADLLSCRYGPGPNYLFLYGLRKGANIVLSGRTNGDNWRWVYVQGRNPCWVKTDFLDIHGNWQTLPIVYPGVAKLPVSPYYPPTTVLSVVRKKDQVTVHWLDIPLRAGDEEDEFMQHYIVEVWRCENGASSSSLCPPTSFPLPSLTSPAAASPPMGASSSRRSTAFPAPPRSPGPHPLLNVCSYIQRFSPN